MKTTFHRIHGVDFVKHDHVCGGITNMAIKLTNFTHTHNANGWAIPSFRMQPDMFRATGIRGLRSCDTSKQAHTRAPCDFLYALVRESSVIQLRRAYDRRVLLYFVIRICMPKWVAWWALSRDYAHMCACSCATKTCWTRYYFLYVFYQSNTTTERVNLKLIWHACGFSWQFIADFERVTDEQFLLFHIIESHNYYKQIEYLVPFAWQAIDWWSKASDKQAEKLLLAQNKQNKIS